MICFSVLWLLVVPAIVVGVFVFYVIWALNFGRIWPK